MNDNTYSKKPFINISVIGVGGAGNNAIENIPKDQFLGINFLFANTDKQVLERFEPNKCIFLRSDEKLNNGLGAGANPLLGKIAAQNSIEEIKNALKDTRLLIITAGLGGGTGTGASPVIAKIAKDMEILTVAIVTNPFSFEGPKRKNNADIGLEELKQNVDSIVIVSNDKLLNNYPNIAIMDAFKLTNNVLKNCIKSFTDLMLKSSIINLDFADLSSIIKNKGEAYIGFGRGFGKNKIEKAIDAAINSKIIETSIKGLNNAIINIIADPTVSIQQTNEVIEKFKQKSGENIDVIFGFDVNQNLQNEIQISIIATFNKNRQNVKENNNCGIDIKKTQDKLVRIGNTLELELTGEKSYNTTNELFENNKNKDDENIFIEFDDDDDIPFFLK